MTTDTRTHPAKYGDDIVQVIATLLDAARPDGLTLDPFAGVGRVALLDRDCVAGELEFEWLAQAPPPAIRVQLDATRLPFRDGSIHAWVSSPTYGNRLADGYDGNGVCRKCKGHQGADLLGETCERCGGGGRDQSSRLTYRISLGRPLHHRNTGRLHFGGPYKRMHELAYAEARRVLRPGAPLILNVKDHDRGGEPQGVPGWHHRALVRAGFRHVTTVSLDAKGYGENQHAGNHPELVMAYANP